MLRGLVGDDPSERVAKHRHAAWPRLDDGGDVLRLLLQAIRRLIAALSVTASIHRADREIVLQQREHWCPPRAVPDPAMDDQNLRSGPGALDCDCGAIPGSHFEDVMACRSRRMGQQHERGGYQPNRSHHYLGGGFARPPLRRW